MIKKLFFLCIIFSVFSVHAMKKTNKKHRAYKAKKIDQRYYLYTLLQARETVRIIAKDLLEKGCKEGDIELSKSKNIFNRMARVDRGLSFSTAEIDLIPDIGPMFYSPWSTDYLMVHESPALISWCAYQPSKHISDLFSTELSKNGFVIEHDYKVGEFKVIAIDGVQLKKPINRTHAPLVQKEIKMEELRLIKRYQKELTDEVVPFIPVRPVAEIITAYLYHPTDK